MRHLLPRILPLLLVVAACGTKNVADSPSAAEFAPFVKAYTGGIVGENAVIRIDLQENVIGEGAEALFTFKPALKGTVNVTGPASATFVPEEGALKVGQRYEATFHLEKLYEGAKPFVFPITVKGKVAGEAPAQEGEEIKPAVEIPLQGTILPDKDNLILPLRAVNLSAVEVRVVKIYESNVLMYLQDNDLGGEYSLRRSGRLVYHGDVPLDASKDLHKWNTHAIDLGGLFRKEPGALYRIRLSFRQDQSLWGGREPLLKPGLDGAPTQADEKEWSRDNSYYWDNDYDWDLYNWNESEDPSKPSYYMDSERFPAVQLMASDLGLMAEYAEGKELWVAATDLLTAKPVSGASLEVYDYQLQKIAKGKTDGNGLAKLDVPRKPFAVVAKAGGSVAYLKTGSGGLRNLSRFDVGGEKAQDGLKAFIYGERGVWRPGDTLHVTAILDGKLPEAHPATLEVYTPEGQFFGSYVKTAKDGFYSFIVPTAGSDPTGYWNAYLKIGGSSFHKTLHVETVKPNRLKIETSMPRTLVSGTTAAVSVKAAWLSGGAAGGFPAHAEMTLRKASASPFAGFEKYTFCNPSSAFKEAKESLYKTVLGSAGQATVNVPLPKAENAPGMLEAFVVTSVQEPGGDESFTTETVRFSPFSSYVGVRVPDGEYLETGKKHNLQLAVVDPDGKRVGGHGIEYRIMKIGWNWWWDSPGEDLSAYISGSNVEEFSAGEVKSRTGGDIDVPFEASDEEWGRYLILARDKTSGHVSGRIFMADWPSYRGRGTRRDPESLTMLTFSTDKPAYSVGEKATVYIPAAPGAQALVALENGSGVLGRQWVKLSSEDTPWSFTVTADMAPNIYVHITLLQPYGAVENDLPLRLYGVQRVNVENPGSHLSPVIEIPGKLEPGREFTVKVSEKSGKPMTYTLAIVDEGLLDLTAFKTPDPWSKMYRREALGVSTWDIYDHVIGAIGGKLTPIAAIGGDEDAVQGARKDNRFNPVVIFQGPRTLEKGTDVLKFKLPQYIGSVRAMVVAAHDGAYGSAEKTASVTAPLFVIPSAPAIVGMGEKFALPVNVFTNDASAGSITVSVKADGPVSIEGPATRTVTDGLASFAMTAAAEEGVSHITVEASGGGHKFSEVIALSVKNPVPEIMQVKRFTLAPGESITVPRGTLQLAGFPAVDFKALEKKAVDYPYDCTEQIADRGIILLSLPERSEEASALIGKLVTKLYSRQAADGGFAYWPGGTPSGNVSSRAGEFLVRASKAGFEINAGVVENWEKYQQNMSQAYRIAGASVSSKLEEAYRLYTLALSGSANVSAMNRLREAGGLDKTSGYILASAYALAGKANVASFVLDEVAAADVSYGPGNGCEALEALIRCGKMEEAMELSQKIVPGENEGISAAAKGASAYSLLSQKVPSYVSRASVDGTVHEAKGKIISVPVQSSVVNSGEGPLYGSVLSVVPAEGKPASSGMSLTVKYVDGAGAPVNPKSLRQGDSFCAVITVKSLQQAQTLDNVALSMQVPSGWEIVNERLTRGSAHEGYDYLDIRDNRCAWFFSLPAGGSKTFSAQLRAAYEGTYVLPAIVCESMDEPAHNASTASGTAVVTK